MIATFIIAGVIGLLSVALGQLVLWRIRQESCDGKCHIR